MLTKRQIDVGICNHIRSVSPERMIGREELSRPVTRIPSKLAKRAEEAKEWLLS